MTAWAAGPHVSFVFGWALGDPLLARLPVDGARRHRIGHMRREVPDGYRLAVSRGDLSELDPDLRAYYEPLRRITRGRAFDPGRLLTIVRFNLGAWDGHREAYVRKMRAEAKE
jgi:arabinofuranosyltransferase